VTIYVRAYHLFNNVLRLNNGKTRTRQKERQACVVVVVVATKEPERIRGDGGGGRGTRTSSWWWWLRTKWIDHERGNGMARMREEWRERERNARTREELRGTEKD